MECVETYLDCLSRSGPSIDPSTLAKAKVHTYLAAGPVYTAGTNQTQRRRPGLRLGEAADAGVWDWSSQAFRQVALFLRNL